MKYKKSIFICFVVIAATMLSLSRCTKDEVPLEATIKLPPCPNAQEYIRELESHHNNTVYISSSAMLWLLDNCECERYYAVFQTNAAYREFGCVE